MGHRSPKKQKNLSVYSFLGEKPIKPSINQKTIISWNSLTSVRKYWFYGFFMCFYRFYWVFIVFFWFYEVFLRFWLKNLKKPSVFLVFGIMLLLSGIFSFYLEYFLFIWNILELRLARLRIHGFSIKFVLKNDHFGALAGQAQDSIDFLLNSY